LTVGEVGCGQLSFQLLGRAVVNARRSSVANGCRTPPADRRSAHAATIGSWSPTPRQQHDAQETDDRDAFLDGEPPALAFIHQQLVGVEFPGQLDGFRLACIHDLGVLRCA